MDWDRDAEAVGAALQVRFLMETLALSPASTLASSTSPLTSSSLSNPRRPALSPLAGHLVLAVRARQPQALRRKRCRCASREPGPLPLSCAELFVLSLQLNPHTRTFDLQVLGKLRGAFTRVERQMEKLEGDLKGLEANPSSFKLCVRCIVRAVMRERCLAA
jgi:hypothetical protein